MFNEILIGGSIATVSGVVGFFISKKLISLNFNIYTDQAKAKAIAIEHEAQTLLENSSLKAQELEAQALTHYESAKERAKADLHQRENDVVKKEVGFKRYKEDEERKLHDDGIALKAKLIDLDRNEKSLTTLKQKYETKIDEALHNIENCSGMTKEEATSVLLEKVEERSRAEISHIVRRYEEEAKQEAKSRANYILAQATSRFAGEFAHEIGRASCRERVCPYV